MKVKHNKKRNTAFLYETLIRELTKSIVSNNSKRTAKVKGIIKEHFGNKKTLNIVLECYDALAKESGLDRYTAEKMVFRAKKTYDDLGSEKIFQAQSKLIKEINSSLGSETYNNFVPNYKNLATLSQIFGDRVPLKNRVLLENKIVDGLTATKKKIKELETPSNLVIKKFISRYNQKYGNLLPEQQELLAKYIGSLNEGAADFRVYLLQELKRINTLVQESLDLEDVKEDSDMIKTTKLVLEKINSFSVSSVGDKEMLKILKMQNLVNEYTKDDN